MISIWHIRKRNQRIIIIIIIIVVLVDAEHISASCSKVGRRSKEIGYNTTTTNKVIARMVIRPLDDPTL